MTYHQPVMPTQVLKHLAPPAEGTLLDGTVGGGGHARLLLEASPGCTLLAVDLDPDALSEARGRLAEYGERVRFLQARFDRAVSEAGVLPGTLAGVLLDLGVSSHQLDDDSRGFAFRRGVALDMRMNPDDGESAADFLARVSAEELADVLYAYGEFRASRRIARAVARRRERAELETSDDLVAALATGLGRAPSAAEKARAFQSLRIAINGELDALTAGLPQLRDALRPGAVIVVIAYHSLEDRLVKLAFREWSRACVCPPEVPMCVCRGAPLGVTLTRKPERPEPDEVASNPRSRSARLRAWRMAA